MNVPSRRTRLKKARVQHFRPIKLGGDLNTRERAALGCGCAIYVGISSGTRDVATASRACSEDHQPIVELADALLLDQTKRPDRRKLLVDTCAEVLGEAAKALCG